MTMKKMRLPVIVFLAFPGFSTPSEARVDSAYWTPFVEGVGPGISSSKKREVITIPADSVDDSNAVFGAGLRSMCTLIGDFDIQFEYKLLNWHANNGVRVGMGNPDVIVERASFSPHDAYAAGE